MTFIKKFSVLSLSHKFELKIDILNSNFSEFMFKLFPSIILTQ